MDLDPNASFDSNHGSANGKQEAKKQQFTVKQRMDMYAFCVLELELRGNTVSIKKQQQAIKKALKKKEQTQTKTAGAPPINGPAEPSTNFVHNQHSQQRANSADTNYDLCGHPDSFPQLNQDQHANEAPCSFTRPTDSVSTVSAQESIDMLCHEHPDTVLSNIDQPSPVKSAEPEEKTLLELKEEVAMTHRSYSDYQKTLLLTSSMLREVQKRFSRYYRDTPCPSKTTIKNVFEKCIENGTVENMKNPRKAIKIPDGSEIEQILSKEPQSSLREMAKRLNVSTGTVARRCRKLGIVPESVTLKHQQLAIARRQKQLKQSTGKAKNPVSRNKKTSRQQQNSPSYHDQSSHNYTNEMF